MQQRATPDHSLLVLGERKHQGHFSRHIYVQFQTSFIKKHVAFKKHFSFIIDVPSIGFGFEDLLCLLNLSNVKDDPITGPKELAIDALIVQTLENMQFGGRQFCDSTPIGDIVLDASILPNNILLDFGTILSFNKIALIIIIIKQINNNIHDCT
ncbi:hypothetical protein ACJX0J_032610 [Zea mays]